MQNLAGTEERIVMEKHIPERDRDHTHFHPLPFHESIWNLIL